MEQKLPESIYDITVTDIDGEELSVGDWEGHVIYFVLTATNTDLVDQLYDLQGLFEEYMMRGFFVVAVPTCQFGGEPGDGEEIAAVMREDYDVSFPILAPGDVTGPGRSELVGWLTRAAATLEETSPTLAFRGDARGPFEKFIIGEDGRLLGRFSGSIPPDHGGLLSLIEPHLPVQ